MTDRFAIACESLLRAVVLAGQEDGIIFRYFSDENPSEARQRQGFADLIADWQADTSLASAKYKQFIYELRNNYSAFRASLEPVYPELFKTISDLIDRGNITIALLTSSDSQRDLLAEAVANCISRVKQAGNEETKSRRPYSLTTKVLHFLFPRTFAIYDSLASNSICMWSMFAYDCESVKKDRECRRFHWDNLNSQAVKDGSTYHVILDFYRLVWSSVSDELRAEVDRTASELEAFLREKYKQPRARLTSVDLIDKLLWKANGNPIVLGLAKPPGS